MGVDCSKHRVKPDEDMPFWKRDGAKEKVNYKARLEHKQYLAQESPEPVYDLSECALKNVPSGVFSRCMVMRKQALLLQDNELTSISGGGNLTDLADIGVLDLHNNNLEKLPDEIGSLKNLTTLYLQQNRLKQLPASLGSLALLRTLNLSGNCLKEIPVQISDLTSLRSLDLSGNPKLKKIPAELCKLRCLETIILDEHICYPSSEIVNQGTEAIMRFLCKECDIEYSPPSQCLLATQVETNGTSHTSLNQINDPYQDLVASHLAKAEQIKEQKKQQAMMLEKQLNDAQEAEARLKEQSDQHRKKLLEEMAEDEREKDEEMKRIQREKDEERTKLFMRMSSAEKQTDLLITELMTSNERYSDPKKVMEALETERKEMENRFTIHQNDVDDLKHQEVLRAMQLRMEEDLQREATRRQYEERQGVVQDAINSSLENDKAVEAVLASKGRHQDELISKLLEDEKYQREAFQSLLLQEDDRSQEISNQMERIQSELASLTMVEMSKRDLKVEFELEVLKDKRETLTHILLDLIKKKKERAEDIQGILGEIERGKSQDQENYWLIQYQKLLDSKPQGVRHAEAEMDPKVKRILDISGADRLIPILAKQMITFKQLAYADHELLKQFGVESEYTRNQILSNVELELQDQNGISEPSAPTSDLDETMPSAPSDGAEDSLAASAPAGDVIDTFKTGECVVCLEFKSEIIFLPCGHFCSCSRCEQSLSSCPLCRTDILQRVRLG